MDPAERTRWTEAQAERQLRSLELFGMRFGLDRMRRMMTALGSPERRFDSIHILGTNGKSSTTRMTAAILERHELRTGAYLSPHLVSYRERVLIDGRELDPDAFAAAVARASWAAERVNRTLAEDDHVTQFELLTAAALWEMARREVDVAVVEAGLGGRYDATSVIDPRVTILTNVGLEHTRWLGPTVKDIAEEKLAVVRPRTALVLGADLAAPALAVAERVARERGARIARPRAAPAATELLARGAFQRRNFALARAAAEAYLAGGRHSAARAGRGAGRLLDRRPRAPAVGGRGPADRPRRRTQSPTRSPPWCSRSRTCSPGCRSRWCWACSRTRTPPACSRRSCPCVSGHGSPLPRAAVRCHRRRCSRSRASSASTRPHASRNRRGRSSRRGAGLRERAGRRAGDWIGLPRRGPARLAGPLRYPAGATGRSPELCQMNDEGPSVLTMIGAVALIVALVILVFFAAGYGFGRLFL